ncbi:MAG TPA: 6-phosphogluconolactonase [Candidatus Hydrogenedentes bacterium]|nr:6-phosphogluconolactonase [Candidatus Hydrogenedentota bacterium]
MQTIVDSNPAARIAQDLVAALALCDAPHLAVSGGSTPKVLFQLLANEYRDQVRWDALTIWQVDERSVPPDDPQSNWRMLNETLLSKVTGVRAHRMEAERASGAEDYERLLRAHVHNVVRGIPQLDVVLLGMGGDGHTASLFPGTAALEEASRLVVRNEVPQLATSRVTMTYPLINAARNRWFLAAGADKADAFNRVRAGELPSSRIVDPRWYIDSAAAGV